MKYTTLILVVVLIGCADQSCYNIKLSNDPQVNRAYIDCIMQNQVRCEIPLGIGFSQLRELSLLERASFKPKLDWRRSDGSSQWSEYMDHHGAQFIRVYRFQGDSLRFYADYEL